MSRLLRRPSKNLTLAGLLAASALCSLLGAGVSERLRSAVGFVMTPFGDAGMYLATSLNRDVRRIGQRAISAAEAGRLAEENARLRRALDAVRGELARAVDRQAAEDRLYRPIPYAQWRLVPACVVAADALPYGKDRMVNAGSMEGVADGVLATTRELITDRSKDLPKGLAAVNELPPGLAETAPAVLVGRISHAGAHTATLRLLADKGFRINARIRRVIDPASPRMVTLTGGNAQEALLTEQNNVPLDVVAIGDGKAGLTVKGVYAMDNVRPGDVLTASGKDGLLPAEVHIGRVVEVADDPERRGLFVELKVCPAADPAALRDVYIVVPAALHSGQGEGAD